MVAAMVERPERWVVRKPAVTGPGGVVATQHQAASEVGAEVLADGGNAVDAAIAASFALAAVEPWMSGLGGGGYMLVRPAGEARTWAVSFGMVAPGALEPGDYPLTGDSGADMFGWPAVQGDRNLRGPFAVAVPGQVAGLACARARFGSRPWSDLVAPSCALAARGMAVDWHATLAIAASAPELAQDPGCAAAYLADGYPQATPWTGPAPRIRLGSLAETLSRLAEAGPEDFYSGEIAHAICADMARARAGRPRGARRPIWPATGPGSTRRPPLPTATPWSASRRGSPQGRPWPGRCSASKPRSFPAPVPASVLAPFPMARPIAPTPRPCGAPMPSASRRWGTATARAPARVPALVPTLGSAPAISASWTGTAPASR